MNSHGSLSPGRGFPASPSRLIAAAFLLSTPPALFAQINDSAVILRRRVTDTAGAALTGASVTLGNLTSGLGRVVATDANGNFAFAASSSGRYRPTISAVGFALISESESFGSLDFALEPAALAERITAVSGSRQDVGMRFTRTQERM